MGKVAALEAAKVLFRFEPAQTGWRMYRTCVYGFHNGGMGNGAKHELDMWWLPLDIIASLQKYNKNAEAVILQTVRPTVISWMDKQLGELTEKNIPNHSEGYGESHEYLRLPEVNNYKKQKRWAELERCLNAGSNAPIRKTRPQAQGRRYSGRTFGARHAVKELEFFDRGEAPRSSGRDIVIHRVRPRSRSSTYGRICVTADKSDERIRLELDVAQRSLTAGAPEATSSAGDRCDGKPHPDKALLTNFSAQASTSLDREHPIFAVTRQLSKDDGKRRLFRMPQLAGSKMADNVQKHSCVKAKEGKRSGAKRPVRRNGRQVPEYLPGDIGPAPQNAHPTTGAQGAVNK
ncbi:hypothetical protein FPV67DRAFT_1448708 [Lyophyllum atratum]|nr:hypothetical protein FPV67DRAFT_1448708 [Lyophyllum atratum]